MFRVTVGNTGGGGVFPVPVGNTDGGREYSQLQWVILERGESVPGYRG